MSADTTSGVSEQRSEAKPGELDGVVTAALARAGRELLSMLDSPQLLDRLCQLTAELLHCENSRVLLWDPEMDDYVLVSSYGDERRGSATQLVRIPRGSFASLLTRLEHDGVAQADAGGPLRSPAELRGGDIYTALHGGGKMVGILVAGHRQPGRSFTREQERIALGIAELAGMALEHSRVVRELEQANRLKLEFVGTMSHELRTPLHVIIGYNDLLLEGGFGDLNADQTDTLRRVSERAREVLSLVKSALELSRLEAGGLALEVRRVELPQLFAELDAEVRSQLSGTGVGFTWDSDPNLPALETDGTKLKIVLRHLVDNAIKFTQAGRITVAARPWAGGVDVSVTDTGIGIAPEDLPHVFDPFWRTEALGPQRRDSVGLGLYAVRRLVDVLSGKISVASKTDQGTTFRVWLPLRIEHTSFRC